MHPQRERSELASRRCNDDVGSHAPPSTGLCDFSCSLRSRQRRVQGDVLTCARSSKGMSLQTIPSHSSGSGAVMRWRFLTCHNPARAGEGNSTVRPPGAYPGRNGSAVRPGTVRCGAARPFQNTGRPTRSSQSMHSQSPGFRIARHKIKLHSEGPQIFLKLMWPP